MGCDGGTIPTRDELVRLKKKPEQKDKDADISAKWNHCAITQQELRQPIMACDLGRLYNKESILEILLEKTNSELTNHIKNLKDVTELCLSENPAYVKSADRADGYVDRRVGRYICPVVGLEMNGKYRFCFLRSCGCVFSERALKEVNTDTCHKCGKFFCKDDVIIINGDETEVDALRIKMEERKKEIRRIRKEAKNSKTAAAAGGTKHKRDEDCHEDVVPSTSSKQYNYDEPNHKISKVGKSNGSSTRRAKVHGQQNGTAVATSSSASSSSSIQQDPNTSQVFKSLFTSCPEAQNQEKAHWVTSNPQYYR